MGDKCHLMERSSLGGRRHSRESGGLSDHRRLLNEKLSSTVRSAFHDWEWFSAHGRLRRTFASGTLALATGFGLLTGCAESSDEGTSDSPRADWGQAVPTSMGAAGPGFDGQAGFPALGGVFSPADPTTLDALPPEVELPARFERPAAGARYVYVANPSRNTVAVIDAETRGIETVPVGERPMFVQTVAGEDVAIVINAVGGTSGEVNILRTEPAGTRVESLEIASGANAIAISPDGNYAIVYFDSRLRRAGMVTGSYQDINVLELKPEAPQSFRLTVGFRPLSVTFDLGSERAFVVTEDGISVIDLGDVDNEDAGVSPIVRITEDPAEVFSDVSIAPDGAFAVARNETGTDVRLVNLEDGAVTSLELAAAEASTDSKVTDLDLSPDGRFMLAAVRSRQALLRVPLPDGFLDSTLQTWLPIESAVVGSVSIAPDGEKALVYTTAVEDERLVLLDLLADDAQQAVRLRKGVAAVAVAPDGDKALVIHTKKPGAIDEPGIDDDERLDRYYGYSLVDLRSGAVKLQQTEVDLGPFAVTPGSEYLFILFNNAATSRYEVHRVDLGGFQIDREVLQSPGVAVGVVPAEHQVFVGQEHPAGRITFFDWDTGDYQVVTGFENTHLIRSR